tara:strand:- start:33 stop:1328 length:1296 start_codon:yes stop_codon:yes gene_type:complete
MHWSLLLRLSVAALCAPLIACDAPAEDIPTTPAAPLAEGRSGGEPESARNGVADGQEGSERPSVPVDLIPEEEPGGLNPGDEDPSGEVPTSETDDTPEPQDPGSTEEEEPTAPAEEPVEEEDEGPELVTFAPASDCAQAYDDAMIFACAEDQFWRVLQRDLSDRKTVWELHETLESKLSANPDPYLHGRMVFQRSQIALAMMLEQQDMTVFLTLQPDMERAIEIDPGEPFYVTWLDTVKIAVADLLPFDIGLQSALDEGFKNVKKSNAHTTASSLIASFSGTSVGAAMSTGSPMDTIALLETWDCHPDNLTDDPEQLCGVGELRPCIDWCLANSWKAPYGGPGLMYHLGEAYARVGDITMAQELYELALDLPGAPTWPHRFVVDQALWDMELHVSKFTEIGYDQSASELVYANSTYGCVFCHGAPEDGIVP